MNHLFISVLLLCNLVTFNAYTEADPLFSEELHSEIEVLSWSPRIFVYHHFLSDAECDYLRYQATPFLVPSTVVDHTRPDGRKSDNRRRSEGMFFPKHHFDPVLSDIEKRISLLTLMPLENGEPIQVLHYSVGGEYQPHYDYFNENTVGGASHLNRGGQRVASFLMYLNSPDAGGETLFPIVNVQVKPIKGDALLFFDCCVNGAVDPLTLHGGSPVIRGEKWLATKWFRQYPFE